MARKSIQLNRGKPVVTFQVGGMDPRQLAGMRWQDLLRLAAERKVLRPRMKRSQIEAALAAGS